MLFHVNGQYQQISTDSTFDATLGPIVSSSVHVIMLILQVLFFQFSPHSPQIPLPLPLRFPFEILTSDGFVPVPGGPVLGYANRGKSDPLFSPDHVSMLTK